MSENVRKLIGVAVMAAIVVVGVVVTNDDDTDFTRNRALTDRDVATSSAAPDRSSEADDRSTYVIDYDDEDSSGNESERVTFALELNDEAESGGGASECCDLNAFEIQLLKERIEELESELAEWAGKSGDSVAAIQKELSGLSSTLEDHLAKESNTSNWEQFADIQEVVADLTDECGFKLPEEWGVSPTFSDGSPVTQIGPGGPPGVSCIYNYLVGFPLQLAKQVIFSHGQFGAFHRYDGFGTEEWEADLGSTQFLSSEICEPILFGFNSPPRYALALDTRDGVVIDEILGFGILTHGYWQDYEVFEEQTGVEYWPNHHSWMPANWSDSNEYKYKKQQACD